MKNGEIMLVEPNADYADEIWAFRQEILENDSNSEDRFAGCGCLERCKSAEEWIRICNLLHSEETILANGGVFEKTIEIDGTVMKRYWIDCSSLKH